MPNLTNIVIDVVKHSLEKHIDFNLIPKRIGEYGMPATPEQLAIVKRVALHRSIDFALVCAVIEQESNWNGWAIRFEPQFFATYVAPLYVDNKISATEAYARAISWGAMQVLGEVAREMMFDGPYLSALADFETGVEYGCLKLLKCLDRANGDQYKALEHYNGGGNPNYAGQVVTRMGHYV